MAQTFTGENGFLSTVFITAQGGSPSRIEMPLNRWSLTDALESTVSKNSMSGNFGIVLPSFEAASITCDFDLNIASAQSPWGNGIKAGQFLQYVYLYLDQSVPGAGDGRVFTATNVFIDRVVPSASRSTTRPNMFTWMGRVSSGSASGVAGSLTYPST